MCKKCIGTGYDWDYCRVEKMGCKGCNYYIEGGKCNEQKISEHSSDKKH